MARGCLEDRAAVTDVGPFVSLRHVVARIFDTSSEHFARRLRSRHTPIYWTVGLDAEVPFPSVASVFFREPLFPRLLHLSSHGRQEARCEQGDLHERGWPEEKGRGLEVLARPRKDLHFLA